MRGLFSERHKWQRKPACQDQTTHTRRPNSDSFLVALSLVFRVWPWQKIKYIVSDFSPLESTKLHAEAVYRPFNRFLSYDEGVYKQVYYEWDPSNFAQSATRNIQ